MVSNCPNRLPTLGKGEKKSGERRKEKEEKKKFSFRSVCEKDHFLSRGYKQK